MSLDVPKGLGVGPHQRMMFWALKNEVSLPQKTSVRMHLSSVRMHT